MYIYELLCPLSGDVRYIGKAENPDRRFKRHLVDSALMKSYTNRWIAGLLRRGLKPVMRLAVKISDHENWQQIERECIALGFALSLPLTNTSAGGEGALIVDPEVEAKRIESVRRSWSSPAVRRKQSVRAREFMNRPEVKARYSEVMKQKWADPAYVAVCTAKVKEAYSTPEARAEQSARSIAAHRNPEIAARRSASLKAAWDVPGARDAHKAALKIGQNKPEITAMKSMAMKARHKDPAFREKVRKTMSDPDMIKRRNEAIKAGWARRLERLAQQI